MAEKMGLYQFGPDGLAAAGHRREPRLVHLRARTPTSPLGLASAYSTLAAGGTQCDVVPVTAVLDRARAAADGRRRASRWSTGDQCTPEAIPPGVANTLNQMLRKDVEPGNGGPDRVPGLRAGAPDRRQDRDDAEQRLGRLRRLHARRSPPA